uniref:Alpha/beta hydrolase fold-3 domain-containing protein n=1 Tax=Ciona savignyi TaxID=51511 RepID=H2Z2Y8_CIOSA
MVSHDNIPVRYKQKRKYMSMDDTKCELPHDVRNHVKSMMLNTRIAPLLASDDIVKRIKKTLVLVCEYDPLRDDGILLYQRIKSLKGKVELQYLPTSLHGATTLGAALKNSYYSEQNKILFKAIRDGMEEESVLEEKSVAFEEESGMFDFFLP